jgi:predicted nucleic acid-binding protein
VKIALDLKTVSRLIDGEPPHLRERMDEAQAAGADLVMSSLVLHDLAYAAMASDQAARRLAQLDTFIARVEVVAWTSEDALTAARIRADHDKQHGRPIRLGATELLCAAQALNNDWTVIVDHPSIAAAAKAWPTGLIIPGLGLRTIDWSAPSGD